MQTDVVLPNLGFGMEEGRVIAWLKQVGDRVLKGEPLAEIESDKATVELQSTVDGILSEIVQQTDQVVVVGAVLARIQSIAPIPAVPSAPPVAAPPAEKSRISPLARKMAAEQGVDVATVKGTGFGGRVTRGDIGKTAVSTGTHSIVGNGTARPLAAPAVRKWARDRGIDLRMVPVTGHYGQVTRADLEAYASTMPAGSLPAQPPISTERREVPLTAMRQAIARHLAQSAQEAPHFYVTAELDLTSALRTLPADTGINNLLLYLTIQTLQNTPELNATFEDGHLYHYPSVNLAMAVALPNGLISPVLRHAEDYSLSGLASRAKDLIQRTRENKLRPEELGGGTFTISNLGMVKQVDRFTAIINPPQVAILAVGAAKPRPVILDGGLHVRTTVHLTLSADHRVVDGLMAARFLEAFDNRLQAFSN